MKWRCIATGCLLYTMFASRFGFSLDLFFYTNLLITRLASVKRTPDDHILGKWLG